MRDASDEVTFQYTDQPRMGPRHSFDVQMHGPGASLHHLPGTLSDPLGEGAEDPDADADMDVGGGLAAFFVVVDGMEGSMLVLGIAGITKAPGDGTDGSDGTDGADGTDGTDGTDSTDGSDGSDTLGSGSFFGIL